MRSLSQWATPSVNRQHLHSCAHDWRIHVAGQRLRKSPQFKEQPPQACVRVQTHTDRHRRKNCATARFFARGARKPNTSGWRQRSTPCVARWWPMNWNKASGASLTVAFDRVRRDVRRGRATTAHLPISVLPTFSLRCDALKFRPL